MISTCFGPGVHEGECSTHLLTSALSKGLGQSVCFPLEFTCSNEVWVEVNPAFSAPRVSICRLCYFSLNCLRWEHCRTRLLRALYHILYFTKAAGPRYASGKENFVAGSSCSSGSECRSVREFASATPILSGFPPVHSVYVSISVLLTGWERGCPEKRYLWNASSD